MGQCISCVSFILISVKKHCLEKCSSPCFPIIQSLSTNYSSPDPPTPIKKLRISYQDLYSLVKKTILLVLKPVYHHEQHSNGARFPHILYNCQLIFVPSDIRGSFNGRDYHAGGCAILPSQRQSAGKCSISLVR